MEGTVSLLKINYVIAAWGGPRRVSDPVYEKDRTAYLRAHLAQLEKLKHECHVTVMVATELTPHGLLDADCGMPFWRYVVCELSNVKEKSTVKIRENNGMSFGMWSTAVKESAGLFDYYIFMEDDYVFLLDDFDKKLVEMYEKDCCYLCGNVDKTTFGTGHARHSCGIISSAMAEEIIAKRGRFEYLDKENATPRDHEIYQSQKKFSSTMVTDTGGKLYDVCGKYQAGLRMKSGRTKWYGQGPKLLGPIQCLRHDGHSGYPTK